MDPYDQLTEVLAAAGARLVAVSKTHPSDKILALYERGQRAFGENRVQELVQKQAELPDDIEWHFIGHLQRNKVRDVAPFVRLIHSGDSERLVREVDRRAAENDRVIDVLFQFHIAREQSKYGFTRESGWRAVRNLLADPVPNVRFVGVMGMATFTDEVERVESEFAALRGIFSDLRNEFFSDRPEFTEISMGMSGDYPIALRQGATLVRIGSLLFGARK